MSALQMASSPESSAALLKLLTPLGLLGLLKIVNSKYDFMGRKTQELTQFHKWVFWLMFR